MDCVVYRDDPTTRDLGVALHCFNRGKVMKERFLLSVLLASKAMGAEGTRETHGFVSPCSVAELERPQGHFHRRQNYSLAD